MRCSENFHEKSRQEKTRKEPFRSRPLMEDEVTVYRGHIYIKVVPNIIHVLNTSQVMDDVPVGRNAHNRSFLVVPIFGRESASGSASIPQLKVKELSFLPVPVTFSGKFVDLGSMTYQASSSHLLVHIRYECTLLIDYTRT